jgi:hypothetical protein
MRKHTIHTCTYVMHRFRSCVACFGGFMKPFSPNQIFLLELRGQNHVFDLSFLFHEMKRSSPQILKLFDFYGLF